jgi:hypothetical protein
MRRETKGTSVDPLQLVEATESAARRVWHQRFFQTERGYQGILYYFLTEELRERGLLELGGDRILEIEDQKRFNTPGMKRRPDIVFHTPAVAGGNARNDNYAVWAVKGHGDEDDAVSDFEKLDVMVSRLHYPVGIFINVGLPYDFVRAYQGPFAERLYGMTVTEHMRPLDVRLRKFSEILDGSPSPAARARQRRNAIRRRGVE